MFRTGGADESLGSLGKQGGGEKEGTFVLGEKRKTGKRPVVPSISREETRSVGQKKGDVTIREKKGGWGKLKGPGGSVPLQTWGRGKSGVHQGADEEKNALPEGQMSNQKKKVKSDQ